MTDFRYTYKGDRWTRKELKGIQCNPVMIGEHGEVFVGPDISEGTCIVSQQMANALVEDVQGRRHVVNRRCLRLNSKLNN